MEVVWGWAVGHEGAVFAEGDEEAGGVFVFEVHEADGVVVEAFEEHFAKVVEAFDFGLHDVVMPEGGVGFVVFFCLLDEGGVFFGPLLDGGFGDVEFPGDMAEGNAGGASVDDFEDEFFWMFHMYSIYCCVVI